MAKSRAMRDIEQNSQLAAEQNEAAATNPYANEGNEPLADVSQPRDNLIGVNTLASIVGIEYGDLGGAAKKAATTAGLSEGVASAVGRGVEAVAKSVGVPGSAASSSGSTPSAPAGSTGASSPSGRVMRESDRRLAHARHRAQQAANRYR